MIATLVKVAAALTAASTISYASWSAADYVQIRPVILREYADYQVQQQEFIKNLQEQQTQTLQSINELRFRTLMMQREYGQLTLLEQNELCAVAKQLGYVTGVPGC